MQASQAKNEVRLPRAVAARSAAIEATLNEQRAARELESNPNPVPPEAPLNATPPVDPRHSDPAYWKQRFEVVDGRIRAIGEERRQETAAMQARISELQAQIQTLQAGIPPAPTDVSAYFTPEQIEKFGEEQCRVMATAAQTAAKLEAQALIETQVKPLADARKADQVAAAQAATQRFQDALTEALPNWREVDVTPGWHAWLAQNDESTGFQRQAILNDHSRRQDVARIVAMFRQYEGTNRPPAPPMAPHGTAANGTGAPAAPAPAAKGRPSQAEIKDFYKRAALGKVKDSERAEFEARLKPVAA